MKPAVPVLIAALALSGCGYFWPFADDRARASVEAMNLTDVRLTRTVLGLNCSKSDKIRYKFTARNLGGHPVRGVVCMSYFKGATVRITGSGQS
jgi:hypothetical protein